MKASVLFDTLMVEDGLDHDTIRQVYEDLPERAGVNQFRKALLEAEVMTYSDLMRIFINKTLIPHSHTALKKLQEQKNSRVEFKPTGHQPKFHVHDEDHLVEHIAFAAGDLPVKIPPPNLKRFTFHNSDEKQAVELALDMAKSGELNEAEVILLETLETFEQSIAGALVLCWVYLCTGHPDILESWVKLSLKNGRNDRQLVELLCLAEQLQNKHLMASAHYQKLIGQKRIKSVWFLLLAYSQERSHCISEAIENYRIYLRVGRDEELLNFAKQHVKELLHS